ncbi:MAG: putative DNA binding domain-containing protein [Bacteroidales bacterium]|nr:putative DNA binding domain-containing protein [Bacteroidales bacterium]
MKEYTAQELFDMLNLQDEADWIEAKGGKESSHSVMETVCAFCNEPGLGGGYILMGIAENQRFDDPAYVVDEIKDTDKLQKNIASQAASMFNIPVRPRLYVDHIDGEKVVKVKVNELPEQQKPLYFKSDGLPYGAMRRVGSTDQHCTEDDLHVFYQNVESYDATPVKGVNSHEVDEHALKRYRMLREKVNPVAEELTYSNHELLQALGCVNKENSNELNMAGLLLFGSSKLHRQNIPMIRLDYIRIPGNTWVETPDEQFSTIDMRGPLILVLYRLIDAINADLPKGFLLPDNEIQASDVGLPLKVLREALVNAIMHRSYRENSATQVIRYDNRIEIINPGFSLKPQEKLGEPGSYTRNPFIAAVFHETNLAETKGRGIRMMRRLMDEAHLIPPTFESDRRNNQFVSRLLLHHFLSEEDLKWLASFNHYHLSNAQKLAMVFVREAGAIDNQTYRQMADCDLITAGRDLRQLKDYKLLSKKGKSRATYYVAGSALKTEGSALKTEGGALITEGGAFNTEAGDLNTEPGAPSTEPPMFNDLIKQLPSDLENRIYSLKRRESDKSIIISLIKELCSIRPYKLDELSILLKKGENYISRKFLKPMLDSGELEYKYPEMRNHPNQAYRTKINS